MPDLDPSQPLGVWVRVAAAIVRTALEEQGVVTTADAVRWLDALESTTLDALGDPLFRTGE
jgi:hypothetical protein